MHITLLLLLLLMSTVVRVSHGEITEEEDQGAEYLQNAIRDIQKMQQAQHKDVGNRRVDKYKSAPVAPKRPPAPPPPTLPPTVPPLTLTKSELSAIYEAAANKGDTIKLSSDNGPPINALVHTLDDHHQYLDPHFGPDSTKEQSNAQGYYYYYYPLQSFMDDLSTGAHDIDHNVHISTPYKDLEIDKKPKAVEPLFMAISGFVGMAVMFVLSVVFLPKFGLGLRRSGVKPPPGEVTNIARIAMEAIDGRDCAERLACEIGKRAKAMNLYDNRFVKLFRRIAPPSVAKEIDRVGKYTTKKNRCITIRCKRKPPGALNQPQKQSKTQPPPKKSPQKVTVKQKNSTKAKK